MSIRPRIDRRTMRVPVQTMFAATSSATIGSRRSQPVAATAPTPTMTPADVQTSVNRCCAFASSVMEWCCFPARSRTRATARLMRDAADRHGQADADLLQRLRRQQPPRRGDGDAQRRDQDQRAFDAAREVLRLAVAVGMVLVLGPRRHRQHAERHHGADEVDDGLDRVGEEADRSGQEIRRRLERDGRDGRGNRQPGVAREVRRPHGTQDTRAAPPPASRARRLTAAWPPSPRCATARPRASSGARSTPRP